MHETDSKEYGLKTVYQCEYCGHVGKSAVTMEQHEQGCKTFVVSCTQRFSLCLDCVYHNNCKRYSDHLNNGCKPTKEVKAK